MVLMFPLHPAEWMGNSTDWALTLLPYCSSAWLWPFFIKSSFLQYEIILSSGTPSFLGGVFSLENTNKFSNTKDFALQFDLKVSCFGVLGGWCTRDAGLFQSGFSRYIELIEYIKICSSLYTFIHTHTYICVYMCVCIKWCHNLPSEAQEIWW